MQKYSRPATRGVGPSMTIVLNNLQLQFFPLWIQCCPLQYPSILFLVLLHFSDRVPFFHSSLPSIVVFPLLPWWLSTWVRSLYLLPPQCPIFPNRRSRLAGRQWSSCGLSSPVRSSGSRSLMLVFSSPFLLSLSASLLMDGRALLAVGRIYMGRAGDVHFNLSFKSSPVFSSYRWFALCPLCCLHLHLLSCGRAFPTSGEIHIGRQQYLFPFYISFRQLYPLHNDLPQH